MSSTEFARTLVTELVAAGVRDVVVCPGSRSAPLAYAVADAERAGWLRAHVRADERSAAFMALGLALAARQRGSGDLVAVVTTSGTAVANLHPAVLEASEAGVPLLVLSADRPHELRFTRANQTTDQAGVFGRAARAAVEFPAGFSVTAVRGQLARLVATARGTFSRDPGPVQLNVCFAEPLTPSEPWQPGHRPTAGGVRHLEHKNPPLNDVSDPSPTTSVADSCATPVAGGAGRDATTIGDAGHAGAARLLPGPRTLVLAGDSAGPRAADVALAGGWPLLAEPSSRARVPGAITHYVRLLREGLAADAERVVVFGHPTLSRPVTALLGRHDLEIVVVSPTPRWPDVAGTASTVVTDVRVEPSAASALRDAEAGRAWLRRWRDADDAITATHEPSPMERAALAIWDTDEPLLLGSSNTVRAFDAVAPGAERAARVFANRGLAGIDGLVATARGLAAGLAPQTTSGGVRVVLGDVSLVHDLGGLVRGDLEPEPDLQIVVLDDHGGGIFATLEHRDADPGTFARFFATPQRLDAVVAAAACGIPAQRVAVDDLPGVLADAIVGTSLVVVSLPPVLGAR